MKGSNLKKNEVLKYSNSQYVFIPLSGKGTFHSEERTSLHYHVFSSTNIA